MDDKQREERMGYVEDAEQLREEHSEPEMQEAREIYSDDEDRFMEERSHEEVHERQPDEVLEPKPAVMEKGLALMLDEREAHEFRARWQDIQTEFVDNPRNSVEQADELVSRVINSITENFARERNSLEDHWNRGEDASTEDLRLAIKRYRSFFNRLLTLEVSETEE